MWLVETIRWPEAVLWTIRRWAQVVSLRYTCKWYVYTSYKVKVVGRGIWRKGVLENGEEIGNNVYPDP